MAFKLKKATTNETETVRTHRLNLIRDLTFEVVPMKSLDDAIAALPANAPVSVTASPAKTLEDTIEISQGLAASGHHPIPHISARMVRDGDHLDQLITGWRSVDIDRVFLVGGDAEQPGEFADAVVLLEALLERDHGLNTIGVTAYPDGHSFISDHDLRVALDAKQRMLVEAGVAGYASTQMCFDPDLIASWLRAERAAGLTLPIHLGLPGVVDKARLMKMGVRLGIGQSLSYLKKNKSAVAKMMTSTSYDPNDLLIPLGQDLLDLNIEGLHMFTFNNVAATNQWRETTVAEG